MGWLTNEVHENIKVFNEKRDHELSPQMIFDLVIVCNTGVLYLTVIHQGHRAQNFWWR